MCSTAGCACRTPHVLQQPRGRASDQLFRAARCVHELRRGTLHRHEPVDLLPEWHPSARPAAAQRAALAHQRGARVFEAVARRERPLSFRADGAAKRRAHCTPRRAHPDARDSSPASTNPQARIASPTLTSTSRLRACRSPSSATSTSARFSTTRMSAWTTACATPLLCDPVLLRLPRLTP